VTDRFELERLKGHLRMYGLAVIKTDNKPLNLGKRPELVLKAMIDDMAEDPQTGRRKASTPEEELEEARAYFRDMGAREHAEGKSNPFKSWWARYAFWNEGAGL
jgi:hypothetical protein